MRSTRPLYFHIRNYQLQCVYLCCNKRCFTIFRTTKRNCSFLVCAMVPFSMDEFCPFPFSSSTTSPCLCPCGTYRRFFCTSFLWTCRLRVTCSSSCSHTIPSPFRGKGSLQSLKLSRSPRPWMPSLCYQHQQCSGNRATCVSRTSTGQHDHQPSKIQQMLEFPFPPCGTRNGTNQL